jgi:hypothetical protein
LDIREFLAELNPDAYLPESFDDALIGVAQRFGMPHVAAYDYERSIEILMANGMGKATAEQALVWAALPAGVECREQMPIYVVRL